MREELSVLQREKLDGINGRLSDISDEESAEKALKLFNDLDCDERTYVRYGAELENAAEKYSLTLSDRAFTVELAQTDHGNGCVYSIEKTEIYKGKKGFTKSDRNKLEALRKNGVTSGDCTATAVLLVHAKADESLSDRDKIISELEEMNAKANELYSEISDLNSIISRELYPVDSVIEYILTLINSDFEPWRMKNPNADKFEFEVKLKKMGTSGALFDIVKLNDVSKEIIAKMNSQEVLDNVLEWSKKYNSKVYDLISKDKEYSRKIFALERDGAKKIRKDIIKWEDVTNIFFYFFEELFEKDIKENGYEFDFLKGTAKVDSNMTKKVLELYINSYDEKLEKDEWFNNVKEQANKLGFCTDMKEYKQNPDKYIGSTADYTTIIRIALTNRHNSPDIYQIMQLLGKDETIRRLEKAKENI